MFIDRDYELLTNEYINSCQKLQFICNKHRDKGIQEIDLSHLKRGQGCYYCSIIQCSGENHYRWKGTSSIKSYLTTTAILPWKKDSIANCDYKCQLTGNRFQDIHHSYGMNLIIEELFNELSIEIKPLISDYIDEELLLLRNKCLELHYKHGFGICLDHNIHLLYHNIYKYGDNTPEQFEEFKTRFFNGEFKDVI
jgi:hypothetical protein